MKNIISQITMGELERTVYRALQKSFSEAMGKILLEMDAVLAENRDKRRFQLKDKRRLSFDYMFGQVDVQRNYYFDCETGKYVSLLDQYLAFDGGQMMSPVVQDLAIELAVSGVSYRQASDALEKLLGYPVISHLDNAQEKPLKHFVELLSKQVTESTRDNISYLNQTVRQPVVYALKGLRGY